MDYLVISIVQEKGDQSIGLECQLSVTLASYTVNSH